MNVSPNLSALVVDADAELRREIRDARASILRDLDALDAAVVAGLRAAATAGGRPFAVSTLMDSAAELAAAVAKREAVHATLRAVSAE